MDLMEVWQEAQDMGFDSIDSYLEYLDREKEEHILLMYEALRGD